MAIRIITAAKQDVFFPFYQKTKTAKTFELKTNK